MTGCHPLPYFLLAVCRAALTNMQSVKKFIAKAKIEEVRVVVGSDAASNR